MDEFLFGLRKLHLPGFPGPTMRNFFSKTPRLHWLAAVAVAAVIQGGLSGALVRAGEARASSQPRTKFTTPHLTASITLETATPVHPPASPAPEPIAALVKRYGGHVRSFAENLLSPWQLTATYVQGSIFGWAIVSARERLVEGMISAGINPNVRDFGDVTPLLHAVNAKDGPLVARLLVSGAEPNKAGPQRVTPLMAAASLGHAEMIETLIRSGAQVDQADAEGWRALHYAVAARKLEAVNLLLAANARVADPEVFPLAAATRDWSFIGPLLERGSTRTWDAPARGLLEEAVRAKHLDHLRLLISKHRGAATLEGTKDPLLAYAVIRNDLELARLLLQAGADPNTTLASKPEERLLLLVPYKILKHYVAEEPGMNVMSLAAGMGHVEMVQLLLAHGADKNRSTKSKYRLLPLYFAAWGNHVKCLQALIDKAPAAAEVRIEISLSGQQATLYKNGIAVFRTDISSGQPEKPTPTGQFVITDKKRYHTSNLYEAKMPFFMRLSCKDFGMHEGHLPGYPASHGCIRLPNEAARKLFREVPIGTLVTIR